MLLSEQADASTLGVEGGRGDAGSCLGLRVGGRELDRLGRLVSAQ